MVPVEDGTGQEATGIGVIHQAHVKQLGGSGNEAKVGNGKTNGWVPKVKANALKLVIPGKALGSGVHNSGILRHGSGILGDRAERIAT